MANTMEKWLGYSFSSGSYTGDDYKKFQRAARANLKKQCAEYGKPEIHICMYFRCPLLAGRMVPPGTDPYHDA